MKIDPLENRLRRKVCHGDMSLRRAQRLIVKDLDGSLSALFSLISHVPRESFVTLRDTLPSHPPLRVYRFGCCLLGLFGLRQILINSLLGRHLVV